MPEPIPANVKLAFDKKDIDDNKLIACLSYLGILFLIPLLAAKTSRFAQEHAKQGLILFVAGIISSFIYRVAIVGPIVSGVLFIVAIIAFVKCLMGEFWEVPLLGPLRKKINL